MSVEEPLAGDLRLAIEGNQDAWWRLYDRYRPVLDRWALALTSGTEPDLSRSDLAQEAWLRIWSGLHQFDGLDAPEGVAARFFQWLRQTARRSMLNVLESRQAQRRKPDDPLVRMGEPTASMDPPAHNMKSPSSVAVANETAGQIRQVIEQMPDATDRQLIKLVFWDGVSVRVAADTLGLQYDAARRRFHAALKTMHFALKAHESES